MTPSHAVTALRSPNRPDYRAALRDELRAHPELRHTLTPARRAAIYQVRAEEAESLLALALDKGFQRDSIAALLDDVEREWERARRVSLGLSPDPDPGERRQASHAA